MNPVPFPRPALARRAVAVFATAERCSNPILASAIRDRGLASMVPAAFSVAEAEQHGLFPDYYLRCGDGANYWIGSTLAEARGNLSQACDRHLKPSFGFDYDIEYSFGKVIGGPPWANLSSIDLFC